MAKNSKEEILNIVKREGPLLPSQLAKEINTNILFASAILSELVDKKHLILTNVKKGGSPFYYVKGQENKLEALSEFLGGKPREIFDLLKEKKVLRDKTAQPWQRVALREIKDFAIPLNVGVSGEYEIFWKYFLAGNDETKLLIKESLGISDSEKEEVPEREEEKSEKKPEEEIPRKEEVPEEIREEPKKENKQLVDQENNIFDSADKYFEANNFYVISQDSVRKGKEMNFVVDVPTVLGKLRYFVKVRSKKSISDKDIQSAWDEGNKKKLPILFLTAGSLTKKAEKYLNDNVSGQFLLKVI
jgi:hypothetical protein